MLKNLPCKKFSILIVVLILLVTLPTSTLAKNNHTEVISFFDELLIDDFSSGLNENLPRGEALKLISVALNIDFTYLEDPNFSDISPENRHFPYVAALTQLGIISGFPDQTFRPDEAITRAQIAKLLVTAFELESKKSSKLPFVDVRKNSWYFHYVETLYQNKITTGTSATTYSPQESIKKIELANFIYRIAHIGRVPDPKQTTKKAKEIPVLLYHHLLHEQDNIYKENRMIVSVEQFEQQMAFLYHNDYHVATLYELYQFVKGGISLPEKTVVITFDDGLKSNYEYAYPILKKYHFTAANYLITGRIRQEATMFNPAVYQYFSWEEIETSRDIFEFGGHTHHLHNMNSERHSHFVSNPKIEVINDLMNNIELLNSYFLTFAYPFGQFKESSKQILQELGFKMAFSTINGKVKPGDDLFELKRIFIYPETTIDQFKKIIGID